MKSVQVLKGVPMYGDLKYHTMSCHLVLRDQRLTHSLCGSRGNGLQCTLLWRHLVQSFQRSPSLYDRCHGREHSQNQYHDGNPKSPELLWVSTISPQLSPADWRWLKYFFLKFKKPVSPMIKVQQVETPVGLERARFVKILLFLCEKRHCRAVPKRK